VLGIEDTSARTLCLFAFVALFSVGFFLSWYAFKYHRAEDPRVHRKHYLTRHEKLDLLTDRGRKLAELSRKLGIVSAIPLVAFAMLPPSSAV